MKKIGNLNWEMSIKNQYKKLNSKKKSKLMLESVNDTMWEWDIKEDKFSFFNNYGAITEYNIKEADHIEKILDEFVYYEDKEKVKNDFSIYLKGNSISFQSEFRACTKVGYIKWILMRGKAIKDDQGNFVWMCGSITDTSEIKRVQENIIFMAYHDSITSLPNRILFTEVLETTIINNKQQGKNGAVMFIDIDNFKSVNDTLGHDFGDLLLKFVAELLNYCIGESGMVARFGGDEFLILISEVENETILKDLCASIIQNFKQPFELKDKLVYCTVSIGVTVFPDKAMDTTEILKQVDTAMYYSKSKGKNMFSLFDMKMSETLNRKKLIEDSLRTALENNELELYYQPQIDNITKEIMGLEALLRWNSKELGSVSPNEFISIAEECGLIFEIGEWIIDTATKQGKTWIDKGYNFGRIAINISPVQMQVKYLVDLIKNTLIKNKISPEFIELEITEGTFIKSINENIDLLNELISFGINIAIDDFGKGYSSLGYLTVFPINTIKIDKSFTDNICNEKKFKIIVECIIQLAKSLNYKVIAEGVENVEQLNLLMEIGCKDIQGYYFSKPLPANEIEKIMENNEENKLWGRKSNGHRVL